jgi:hypothetical protein
MSGWENFFVAEVGASAALAGLLFVGVSINLSKIITIAGLPGRAFEGLAVLLAVLVVSSLLLVPGQPLQLVSAEVLLVGLTIWTTLVALQVNHLRKLEPQLRQKFVIRVILGQMAALPFVIAGITMLVEGGGGLYWLVPAVIFSFLVSLLDAWVLLVEINR